MKHNSNLQILLCQGLCDYLDERTVSNMLYEVAVLHLKNKCTVFLKINLISVVSDQVINSSKAIRSSSEIICDWILEKRSKLHIRSFEMNGFKELKPA